ncbi:cupin domain-containing protein [Gramella sp. KN1008]|uniref:cupin domain-containing protein n=1 Tax=Gramella sp. KN1008 TaxID=2529298 RepID=UPI00103E8997|nr:cupin domain-containing protein [Gramella sp. KN1008]TBW28913.1 cupin domain-containing protein [Gramella sp. KN1008]
MKKIILPTRIFLVLLLFLPVKLMAQDAVKLDPKHYKVELDNDKVRILRINYQPGEESVMHSHPEGVAVFLTDHKAKMKTGDGESFEMGGKKGDVVWVDKAKHQPSNIGDTPFELIQIELKSNSNNAGKKSLHLFELPEGVTEKQLSDHLKEMNQAISEEGYPNAGYHLYKIQDENSDNYQYFLEGVWPDAAAYDKIHASQKWKDMAAKGKDMIDKIQANELYLKAERVN